ERAHLRILRAGRIGARQDGFGHLVEQGDVGGGKRSRARRQRRLAEHEGRHADHGHAGGRGDQFEQFAALHHRFPALSSRTAWSAARAVSAMWVSDGLTQLAEVMQAPSVTYTLGASQTGLCALSTEVFGSRPLRAVAISWIALPGTG